MKGFQFKLQAVLEYREKEVDQQQAKVAEEEMKRLEIFQQIQLRDEAISQAFLDQQEAMSQPQLDLNRATVFAAYLNRLKNEKAALQVALSQQAQRVNKAREALKQAVIKKKSMELLKEKEHERFRKKMEKAEEAFLSELALNRMIHQSKG